VRSIAASKVFYDAVFEPLGYSCLSSGESSLGYGKDNVKFWLGSSTNPVLEHSESGLHFCFDAASRKMVEAFYGAAIRSGGRDNGKPGLREAYGPNYYAAFVIDPEGYRIEAYCSAPG
jgi:hypothetical protein